MKHLITLIALLFSISLNAQEIIAGTHYKIVGQQTKEDTTEVYEFFGYTCPACNLFEPYLDSFEESNSQVKIIRVPLVFYPSWKPFAQAFYTAETMGILDSVHKPIFHAIHLQKKNLKTIEDIAAFLESELNVNKDNFLATSKSFTVDSKVRKAQQLAKRFGVSQSPSIIVNGKYISNTAMLPKKQQSYEFFMKVVKYLTTLD